ncbi:MAG: hypothetical protein U9O94_02460 [Nanoarchaeota archaeon]|nr:hypothetical protein [Nanoarchaeota archaeon]
MKKKLGVLLFLLVIVLIGCKGEEYCKEDSDCVIQATDNCCGIRPINKEFYEHIPRICTQVCEIPSIGCVDSKCMFIE